MRETVERPDALVDITGLPYRDIDLKPSRLRIGALVRMSELAADPGVREQFPVIAQSLELSASAQIRNMASIGGNLMQRPRCLYFRDVSAACNRRSPGTGCAAIAGATAPAILGTSDACVATHRISPWHWLHLMRWSSPDHNGESRIRISDLFLQPGSTPDHEHSLGHGALITAVEVPVVPESRRSGYLKVRDRESFEFAIASTAVALNVVAGTVRAARVAVGGVATVPWRLPTVEQALIGGPRAPISGERPRQIRRTALNR
jgi:xanthine dehydrogenase YagS FAD-binding subunit